MNAATIIVLALLALALAAAVIAMRRGRGLCSGCAGDCAHCKKRQ